MIYFQSVTRMLVQKKMLFFALVLSLITFFLFREAASAMFDAWQQEEYSYGYLVPLITLLLLLNKMHDEKITPRSSWLGFGIVATCVITQFLFQAASVRGLQPQIFLLSLVGLFTLFYGLNASRVVAGPLLFVMFAAPLPKFFYYSMSFKMQMMSTALGTDLLALLGISAYRDGNVIDLGSYQLQVVEACNGLRFLFPLMCLGYLMAYMFKASFVKRAIIFSSTIPISIFMNSLRITLVGVTVESWGPKMAEGLIHDFEGWLVFMGCTLILLAEIQIMQLIDRNAKIDFERIRLPSLKNLPLPRAGTPSRAAAIFLSIALVVSIGTPIFFPHYVKPVPLQKPLTEFPLQLGPWAGRLGVFDEKVLAVLGTEDYLIADYTKAGAPSVNFYVLYYPKQDSTSNQAVHSPSVCLPGGGWKIESSTTKTFTLPHNNEGGNKGSLSLPVNRLVISKGQTKQLVFYWFIQDGKNIADPYASRLAVIKNALFKGRTNGAMIRVITDISGGESESVAEERLAGFVVSNYELLIRELFGL